MRRDAHHLICRRHRRSQRTYPDAWSAAARQGMRALIARGSHCVVAACGQVSIGAHSWCLRSPTKNSTPKSSCARSALTQTWSRRRTKKWKTRRLDAVASATMVIGARTGARGGAGVQSTIEAPVTACSTSVGRRGHRLDRRHRYHLRQRISPRRLPLMMA